MAEKNCENCAREDCAFIPPAGEVCCGYWHSDAPAVKRWIPCGTKLPRNREFVIFTIDRGARKIGCGYRIHNERGELLSRWFDKISGLNFSDYDVIAWMPMPDAYEPPEKTPES